MKGDAILEDLKQVRIEMQGISPKLSSYKKLQTREQELLDKLQALKMNDPGAALLVPQQARDTNTTILECFWHGCTNKRFVKGTKAHGLKKLSNWCEEHRDAAIKANNGDI